VTSFIHIPILTGRNTLNTPNTPPPVQRQQDPLNQPMSRLPDPARRTSHPRSSHVSSDLGPSFSDPPNRSISPAASGSGTRGSSRRRRSSASKENEPLIHTTMSGVKAHGDASLSNGEAQVWRESLEPEDSSELRKRSTTSTHRTKSPSPSPARSRTTSSIPGSGYYNGLPTLPPISDNQDLDFAVTDSPMSEKDFRPPPPAPSSAMGTEGRPMTRPRRSSSIKRKLSPGVRPAKAVDWEIPRKTLHSSIGKSVSVEQSLILRLPWSVLILSGPSNHQTPRLDPFVLTRSRDNSRLPPLQFPNHSRDLGNQLWLSDARIRARQDQRGGVLPHRRDLCPRRVSERDRCGVYPHVSFAAEYRWE
jgi:hypothetical protein